MQPSLDTGSPPRPRLMGWVNWRGLWTLYLREVRRFLNVYTQTVVAPVITALLFLAIFVLALDRQLGVQGGVSYAEFLMPGLAMMAVMQNAFANTSSSLVIAKIHGTIVDVLMPPLSPGELTLGIAGGGLSRGIIVGLAVCLAMAPFVPFNLHDPLLLVFHAVNASLMLGLLGMAGGIWAEKFDQISAVTNFVITPMTFLSGTFYSIERLPESWQFMAFLNPFFYLIDGFRYGFIGHADASIVVGVAVVLATNAGLYLLVYRMIATGYRLKA